VSTAARKPRANAFVERQIEKNTEKTNCALCPQIEALSPQKRADLHEALGNQAITTTVIIDVLTGWGVIASMTGVRRHRARTVDACNNRIDKKWAKR
jgi:hypothetical protein